MQRKVSVRFQITFWSGTLGGNRGWRIDVCFSKDKATIRHDVEREEKRLGIKTSGDYLMVRAKSNGLQQSKLGVVDSVA